MIKKIRDGLKREDGFTLIEMLVVVAVLGILATLAVPRIADVTHKAEDAVAKANVKNFHVSMISYRMDDEALEYPSTEGEFETANIDPADYGITDYSVASDGKAYVAQNSAYVVNTGNITEDDFATASSGMDSVITQ